MKKFSIQIELENDGRWIAEIPQLPGVMAYDKSIYGALESVISLAAITLKNKLEREKMKNLVRWHNLTEDEKIAILGESDDFCGGKAGWLNPPDFLFSASCQRHDYGYWRGCTEQDREAVDNGFYKAMLYDISDVGWYRRWYLRLVAWTYYQAVRAFGKKYFYYGDEYRGRKEIDEVMGK